MTVASSFKLSKRIQSELRQYGISVQVARTARDLGVCLNPGSRRSTAGIHAKRLVSAKISCFELVVMSGPLRVLGNL